jgi:hypothetical protein
MPAKKTRKRGGQPRNKNALKHGFYSLQFKEGEITDLEEYLRTGLQDEIAMMRVVTRRVMDLANEQNDLGGMINTLSALGLAATRLAGLLRVQKLLGGDDGEVTRAVNEALNDVLKEWDRI